MKNNKLNYNTLIERIHTSIVLIKYGISVDLFNGQLRYLSFSKKCYCRRLDLLRHGKTVAVENGQFMSNSSANSVLSETGVVEIKNISKDINNISPDVILYAPIERTVETFEILNKELLCNPFIAKCDYMVGINNSVWGDKEFKDFDYDDLLVFLQRECSHNIFIKTCNGDSWGDVLIRCARLLEELNTLYFDKKVLLISQGSIFHGMNILLHKNRQPWDGYSPSSMFGTVGKDKLLGYGCLLRIV